ncbi:MAG: Crp/Fnr family transcriptional regulator [Sphingobacteriales bacterium]|nr:MAG: Crp/Fnr family transcriptional regulator [Sphingobacteriales bacterium]TAF83791.1 MAG: Crp/Fnr family transcriptional regulator [Sphingobacteriales bacterium]
MNDNLKNFFERLFGQMPQNEWELLKSILEPIEIQKGADIHKIGKYCKHLWFLQNGAVRVYENSNGYDRTTHFFIENNLFIDYHSVLKNSPSEIGFKAEEKCILQQMPYDKLLLLFDKSHFLERLARLMAERQFVMEFELRRQLLNFDALERYEFLIKTQPYIFQRFALKDIASFIGITPVSLSRLRKLK